MVIMKILLSPLNNTYTHNHTIFFSLQCFISLFLVMYKFLTPIHKVHQKKEIMKIYCHALKVHKAAENITE